jgi:hypothetical protein
MQFLVEKWRAVPGLYIYGISMRSFHGILMDVFSEIFIIDLKGLYKEY